jgi:predicted transcriptional regulator
MVSGKHHIGEIEGETDMAKRLTVTFPDDTSAMLDRLARETGKSKADILRDAIALEDRVQETKRAKGRVLLEEDGQYRELLVR